MREGGSFCSPLSVMVICMEGLKRGEVGVRRQAGGKPGGQESKISEKLSMKTKIRTHTVYKDSKGRITIEHQLNDGVTERGRNERGTGMRVENNGRREKPRRKYEQ